MTFTDKTFLCYFTYGGTLLHEYTTETFIMKSVNLSETVKCRRDVCMNSLQYC